MQFFKKLLSSTIGLLSLLLLLIPTSTLAQVEVITAENDSLYITNYNVAQPTIINKPILFSAKPLFDITTVNNVQYTWNFGDGNQDIGTEVAHIYANPGNFQVSVTAEIVNNSGSKTTEITEIPIFVAQNFALLIADQDGSQKRIDGLLRLAKEDNIDIKLVEAFNSQSSFLSEEILAKKLTELSETTARSDTIIVWTESGTGMNALIRFLQNQESNTFQNTSIIYVTNEVKNLQRIQRQFEQINNKEIIVVRESALLAPFLDSNSIEEYKNQLTKGGYEFTIIDQETSEVKPWRILTAALSYLTSQGIPDNILLLIIMLPVIATVIAFLKQIIGVATLGLYTPAIITLTFLILGLKFGLILLFFLSFVSFLTHRILKKFKMLYIPKMAILITIVSLAIFILFAFALYLNILEPEFISLAIFPTVVMGTLIEKIVNAQSGKSLKKALYTIIEVSFVSIFAYFIVGGTIPLYFTSIKFTTIQNFISNYPEAIFGIIIINVLLGKWTGLRLTEYINFRDVLYNTEE